MTERLQVQTLSRWMICLLSVQYEGYLSLHTVPIRVCMQLPAKTSKNVHHTLGLRGKVHLSCRLSSKLGGYIG